MIPMVFSIAGVIVGIIAVGTSTSVISDSEALILIGISLICVAIRLRRGKGMRD